MVVKIVKEQQSEIGIIDKNAQNSISALKLSEKMTNQNIIPDKKIDFKIDLEYLICIVLY
ncbi:hypothetical protein [Hanstruepera flava]|uniref:hypothetical protein n=1 Tax=Hanstruepera flava TaxID=2930218 RepID=UPI00202861B4|nr:hypothetical protein [Hanstruepera flava]